MHRNGYVKAWGGVVIVLSTAVACMTSSGQGSETHFVCSSDAECAARNAGVCVATRCVPPASDAGSGGSGGAPSSGGAGGQNVASGGSTNVLTHDSGVAGGAPDSAVADASQGTFAYFYGDMTDYGSIYGVPPGAPRSVLLEKGMSPETIARAFTWDATNLYYTIEGDMFDTRIVSVPIHGGAVKTLAEGLHLVDAIAVDDTALYLADRDFTQSPQTTTLVRVPLNPDVGDAGAAQTLLGASPVRIDAISVYGESVYWASNTGVGSSMIWRGAKKSGGVILPIVPGGLTDVRALHVDATGVYWLDVGTMQTDCTQPDGKLQYVPTGTGSNVPVTLASNLHGASSFAVADGVVYFAVRGAYCNVPMSPTGSISKVTLPSGAPQTIAGALYDPSSLYFDGRDVYYVHSTDALGDGSVAAVLPH